MDVFAAGAMLGELLAGAPLLRETDPLRAVRRVQEEDLLLPAHTQVDETLRGIVQRALARDVLTRYDSARAMHAALAAWLQPEPAAEPEPGTSHATLEFLLRRMRHKTDFPALSASVVRIQRLAASETDSLRNLTDEILKDVALTNKLLRMVNTAHFTAVAGGVSTVSRAVALVGFGGIRNMALSMLLLEHMGDKAHAAQLKEEFLRALMAGMLASELAPLVREGEEAFLASMFQNLGRLLTEYYLQEESVQIRQLITRSGDSLAAREAASRRVLGIGFEELGAGVARAWGLPETLQHALRPPAGEPPLHALTPGVERMRWLGRVANALTEALLGSDGEQQAAAVQSAATQYAATLGLSARQLVEATHGARTRLAQVAQAMGLQVAPGAPARRLLGPGVPQATETSYDKTLAIAAEPPAISHEALSHGLDELRSALATGSLRLNEVLNLVLDTMHRALAFRCVVLCLRDPRSGHLVGRVGIGPGAAEASAAFHIVTGGAAAAPDLFAALCARGADLLIADASTVATRLPAWYRQKVNAPTFLLLPMQLHGAPIGLIYADKATARTILIEEKELQLLRGLRDEAVDAFKRAGKQEG
jgi:HD-like signal output (HDOD) protein